MADEETTPATPDEPTAEQSAADASVAAANEAEATEHAIVAEAGMPLPDSPSQAPAPEADVSAYKVSVGSFHGPLDLLLHLIRKHEVDIYDIPIVLITEQYNAYLDAMAELDLDIAADYIFWAAQLIHIKSKMLLPRDEEDAQTEDPRQELVDRLLEYQRFKAVAETFAELDVVRMGMWARPPVPVPGSNEPTELDMSDVGLFDLVDAFRTALARYRQNHPQAIELQRTVHKISDKMRELYAKVSEKSPIRLQWFLEGRDRNELIALFLGTLELVRLGGISLQQGEIFGEILMAKTDKEIDEATFAMFENS